MNEKENRLFGRFMNVYNAEVIQSAVFPENNNASSQPLATSLWDNYVKSRDTYLRLCGIEDIPSPLKSPYFFFYSKNNSIFTIDFFPYGAACKSNILTPKTFPSFLTNVCNIPHISGGPLTQFYMSLYIFIRDYPRNTLQIITNQIRRFSAVFAALLDSPLTSFYVTSEGNLLFDSYALFRRTSAEKLRFQSVLYFVEEYCNPQQGQFYIPFPLLKHYFFTLKRECNNHFFQYEINKLSLPEILFAPKWGSVNISVKYDVSLDIFLHSIISAPVVNLKTSFIEKRKTTDVISNEIESFFWHLCGSDISLVEKLSLAFAQIMSPKKGGMTILLSQHNSPLLQKTFNVIFENDIVKFSKTPSINKIVKTKYMMDLFLAQFENKSVVFIRDILPHESNTKAFRRMLNGRPVSVKSNFLPNQSYHNHLHFVCVTPDRNKAKDLQKKFKATLIDLSPTETPISSINFSEDDIHWFRTAFTLYGLKLQTLRNSNVPNPSPFLSPVPSPTPTLEEELRQFLSDCCTLDRGSFCDTEEVYLWYTQFIQNIHAGKTPVWTKVQFNKHLRDLIADKYKKDIIYKRNHHSRSASSKYGYQGLKLSSLPAQSKINQSIPENLLRDYLNHISQYDIEFKELMEVSVLRE